MYLEAALCLMCGIISSSEIDGSSPVDARVEIRYSERQNLNRNFGKVAECAS